MYFAEFNGVYFIEGAPREAVRIEPISTEIRGMFTQAQLRTLDDLKQKMREHVVRKGGNCVTDFKYGQRSTFWKMFGGMDNVFWYGSGNVAKIDPSELEKYRRI